MRKLIKRTITVALLVLTLLVFTFCEAGSDSGFSIDFVDVGHGDAALVSCDGHYMLIDGGPKGAAEKVIDVLEKKNVTKLDYLIISHMHEDHIGGLQKILSKKVSTVESTFSVESDDDSDEFFDFHQELLVDGCCSIQIPKEGDKFYLGSATIEIIVVGDPSINENESLVILVTYGETTFLFTGDMDYRTEKKIADKYADDFKITLLKVAHHGSETSTETRFINATMPEFAVISVGKSYDLPSERVLSVLEQAEVKTYRTDVSGTITVTSDGKVLSIETQK